MTAEAIRHVGDRERRSETGTGGDAEQIRIGERVPEDALVGGAREGEHHPDERGEADAGDSQLPQNRVVGRAEWRGRPGEMQVRRDRAQDRSDADVDRARDDAEDERDEKEGDRHAHPQRA